jgi:hypothetical protein
MQTKKEYAIERGLAKPGPGRMSREAHEAITKAINAGVKFADPNAKVVSVTVKGEDGTEHTTTKRMADVFLAADPRTDRHEGLYEFQNPDGSTFKRLHTNACVKCSMSFRWCCCSEGPTQWAHPHRMGDSEVLARLVRVPPAARAA